MKQIGRHAGVHEYVPGYVGPDPDIALVREIANKIKVPWSIDTIIAAANAMAPYIPDKATLVPIPNHRGQTLANAILAYAIQGAAGGSDVRVADVLTRKSEQESSHARRQQGLFGLGAADHEIILSDYAGHYSLPPTHEVVFIDNVVVTGATLDAATSAVGKGRGLAYAWSPDVAGSVMWEFDPIKASRGLSGIHVNMYLAAIATLALTYAEYRIARWAALERRDD